MSVARIHTLTLVPSKNLSLSPYPQAFSKTSLSLSHRHQRVEMPIASKPVFKVLTMADSCLLSLPSLGNSKTMYPCYSFPLKPIKLHLSRSSTRLFACLPSLSLRRKTRFSSIGTSVAQTSDWAPIEDQSVAVQQREEDVFGANFSDGEADGEDFISGGEEGGGGIFEEREDGEYGEPAGDGDVVEPAEGDDFVEPPADAKLFVGNLPYDVDCDALAALFDQAGTVEVAEIIYNRETERSRGFGFVTMSTVEEAENAVEKFHRYELGGRLLTVNKAAPPGARVERPPRVFEPSFTVYVGNLPWDVDDARLEQIFSEYGKVISARVVYDRETNRSRGFAFVKMASETEMNDAIAALDGQNLDGRPIRVSVAEDRPRR